MVRPAARRERGGKRQLPDDTIRSSAPLVRGRPLRLAGWPKLSRLQRRLGTAPRSGLRHGEHLTVGSREKLTMQSFHGHLEIRFAYDKPEAQRGRPRSEEHTSELQS